MRNAVLAIVIAASGFGGLAEAQGRPPASLPDWGFELRDPRSGFVAYVPLGSLAKGAALVAGGGYLVRQLWDMQQGSRRGTWSALMKPAVENLTSTDMLAIAAYVSSLGR